MRRSRIGTCLIAVALLAGSCGSGESDGATGAGDPPAAPDETTLRYGYGPQDDDSVTYQSDVVLIGGGPEAIRSVSDDGLVWTMDADADGIDELREGKVMFASSAAAGRVVDLVKRGDVVEVTLAPVALTEVVRDARLVLDEPLALEGLSFREIPDLPGAFDETETDVAASDEGAAAPPDATGEASTVALPPLELIAVHQRAAAPADGESQVSADVSGWKVTAYRTATTVGLKASHGLAETAGGGGLKGASVEGGLKVDLDAHLEVSDLKVTADVPITRGVIGQSHFMVEGLKGLEVSIEGGAGNGLSDNRNVKLEIPVQLTRPVIVGGFPAMLTLKFKFLVQSAFTAQNGNLSASGSWGIDGPLGFDGATLTTPAMAERGTKVIDSIEGVSVGVNGLVVATAFEFGLLVGLPVVGAGPVASFIMSMGLVNGSDLGLVKCRQATLTATLTAGVGLNVFDPVRKALKSKLGLEIPKQTTLITEKLLEETWYVPRVEVCKP